MRWSLLGAVVVGSAVLASAPPPPENKEIRKLVAQLDDDDVDIRKAAMKKLEAMGDTVVPLLRRELAKQKDAEVKLRLGLILRAIHARNWGPVKAFGPGAATKVYPPGGGYWFNRVRLTPDGKHAVVAGGAVILYDLKTGKELKRVLEVGGARPALVLSKDGKKVLTGHANSNLVHLLEVPSLKTLRAWKMPRIGVTSIALSPDGKLAAAVNGSGLYLWDTGSAKAPTWLSAPDGSANCIAFSPDGKQLLSGETVGPAYQLAIWDVGTKKRTKTIDTGKASPNPVAFLPDGNSAVTGDSDGFIRIRDLKTGKVLRSIPTKMSFTDLAISRDGKRAISCHASVSLFLKVWNLETGKLIETFEGHVGGPLGVDLSPDGRQAVSCDSIAAVRLWKLGK